MKVFPKKVKVYPRDQFNSKCTCLVALRGHGLEDCEDWETSQMLVALSNKTTSFLCWWQHNIHVHCTTSSIPSQSCLAVLGCEVQNRNGTEGGLVLFIPAQNCLTFSNNLLCIAMPHGFHLMLHHYIVQTLTRICRISTN